MIWPNQAKRLLIALACVVGLQSGGCSTVTSPAPVGSKVTFLDSSVWNGHWRCGGLDRSGVPAFFVTVVDADNGQLSIRYIDSVREDGAGPPQWKLQEFPAVLRSTEHAKDYFYFLSAKIREPSSYIWGLVEWSPTQPRRFFVWSPNYYVLSALVKQGRIKAEDELETFRSELELSLDDEQLEAMIPPALQGSEQSAGKAYIPDAFSWTEPWFCERMD